jgi:S-adenosylmethionine-diacylgycerolhomoserine-N-methlytransferase
MGSPGRRHEGARDRSSSCIAIAQADATAFDARALFGHAVFDRVMISYALSMIPCWREALRTALRRWLAAFDISPRDDLAEALGALAASRGLTSATEAWRRGYAVLAVASRSSPDGAAVPGLPSRFSEDIVVDSLRDGR